MKYSEFFIPTVKDVPSDAEIISHKLMIKAEEKVRTLA